MLQVAAAIVASLFLGLGLAAREARAYGCESLLTDACHEKLTMAAMKQVRRKSAAAKAVPLDDKLDKALVYELPFKVDKELRELGTVTLLLGNRWVDFKDLLSRDTDNLAYIHGDPEGQKEHFLRREEQDEDNGGAKDAIDAGYAYVQAMAFRAIESGLDAKGQPDPDKRTVMSTFLNYSGTVNVKVPIFYLYMGQATHTLQDAWSHVLRTPDGMKITSPLNAIEMAEDDFDERRDGPPHMTAMDQCEDLDPRRAKLRQIATQATVELLVASLQPGKTVAQRKAAVSAVLDTYLGYQSGCTFDNRWCDAPENEYRDPQGCTCETASGGMAQGWPFVAVLLLLLLAGRRRGWIAVLAVLSFPAVAHGQEAVPDRIEVRKAPPPPRVVVRKVPAKQPVCVPGRQLQCACGGEVRGFQTCRPDGGGFSPCVCPPPPAVVAHGQAPPDPGRSRWGLQVMAGAALDKTAFAFSAAGRFRLFEKWLLGLGLEWNPWASFEVMQVNEGAFNIYGTLIRRWPVSENVAMRTSGHFGLSILLLDLVGAPSGSVGLYIRMSIIGLEWRLSRLLSLIIDPADVTMPIPRVTGTPLSYIQYRFSVGLQIGL